MDLYSMIKRENFFDSFFPTVETYFKEVLHEDVKIGFAQNGNECNCVIKPRLSVVTSIHPSRKAKSIFYSEWNIRKSVVKNVLAKIYIWLMTNSGRLFAEYKMCFCPEELFSNGYVIAPNNRTIRFFDYDNNIVGCICKDGFTDKYMKNQIQFRTSHNYDFVLEMKSYGSRWFTEPIMYGHPLARVTNEALYKEGLEKAVNCIKQVAIDRLQFVSSYEYCNNLVSKVEKYLYRAQREKEIKTTDEVNEIIKVATQMVNSAIDTQIPISDSHGDFQTGNIWMDNNKKIWLYDWETADIRSIWYDLLVLKYSLRRAEGWGNMLCNLSEEDVAGYIIKEEVPLSVIKGIVMLEDLVFYFEDMLELPQTWGNDIFDSFVNRMDRIVHK